MSLKLLAIGGFGKMLSPSAQHLLQSNEASFIRVLDRGTQSPFHDTCRQQWQTHGAVLVPTLAELVGDGDFDGLFICAGKNGDDYKIFSALVSLLPKRPGHKPYFIVHMSTVSTRFVRATYDFCQQQGIEYVNYPLTGGAMGAAAAKMLILASGNKALFHTLEPMLTQIGLPRYFGEDITLSAGVKLIGHIMVFHGLLGLSLAVQVQSSLFSAQSTEQQIAFFDFLNNGAGGTKQWDLNLRSAIQHNNWSHGFMLHHAIIDLIYTMELMLSKNIPTALLMPLAEIVLLFSYLLQKHPNGSLATQAIVQLLAAQPPEEINAFIAQHLDNQNLLASCQAALPHALHDVLMLKVKY